MMKRFVFAGLVFAASGVISNAGAQTVDAKAVYDANCKKCHGVAGTPSKAMAAKSPKLAAFDAAFFAKRSDDSVVKVLTKGKSKDMPSFNNKMTPAEMAAVAKYVRAFATKAK
jgi:mono/diheme cytochrome c family protein